MCVEGAKKTRDFSNSILLKYVPYYFRLSFLGCHYGFLFLQKGKIKGKIKLTSM